MTRATRDEVIDQKGVQKLQDQLRELEGYLQAAREAGNLDQLEKLEEARAKINSELGKAKDIRGNSRLLGDADRSVFNSVIQAIDRAIAKFKTANPPLMNLASHLETAIEHGGGEFWYRQDGSSPDWEL